jgi:hypothetical protein
MTNTPTIINLEEKHDGIACVFVTLITLLSVELSSDSCVKRIRKLETEATYESLNKQKIIHRR